MPAGQVHLLPQTPLLFKYAYWLSAAARWMVAGSILHFSWCCASLSILPFDMVSHYRVMPHYRPYLLKLCLNISPAVLGWCLSSTCLLLWCLTTGNVSQMKHEVLRRDLVQYLSCNKEQYCHLVDGSMEAHLHNLTFTD